MAHFTSRVQRPVSAPATFDIAIPPSHPDAAQAAATSLFSQAVAQNGQIYSTKKRTFQQHSHAPAPAPAPVPGPAPSHEVPDEAPLPAKKARIHPPGAGKTPQLAPRVEVPAQQALVRKATLDCAALFEGINADRFKPIRTIGEGNFGIVQEALDSVTGRKVAIKTNKVAKGLKQQKQEARILQQLQGLDHVPLLISAHSAGKNKFALVEELLPSDVQRSCIDSSPDKIQLDFLEFVNGAWQGLGTLCDLQDRHVLHRDIKPENFTLDTCSGIWKLVDFGLAKVVDPEKLKNDTLPQQYTIGTCYYQPPEMHLESGPVGFAGDIWSFGCALFEVATDEILFKVKDASSDESGDGVVGPDVIAAIAKIRGAPAEELLENSPEDVRNLFKSSGKGKVHRMRTPEGAVSRMPTDNLVRHVEKSLAAAWRNKSLSKHCSRFADLLDKILVWDPKKRITAQEARRHKFFAPFFPLKIELDPKWKRDIGKEYLFYVFPASSYDKGDETPLFERDLAQHPELSSYTWERDENDKYLLCMYVDGEEAFDKEKEILPGSRLVVSANDVAVIPPKS